MVKLREAERDVQSERWLQALTARFGGSDLDLVTQAYAQAASLYADTTHASGQRWLEHVRGTAAVLGAMRMDAESLAAALLLGVAVDARDVRESLLRHFGSAVVNLVAGVASMSPIQALRARADAVERSADKAAQLEALRKMLLAMVQDVRVVLIKLADQIQLLRFLIEAGTAAARVQAARDTFELLAPLANRLGVWQIKWELEDLAFRCEDPETYRTVARQLDEKRIDREAYIAGVIARLREALANAGIAAEIAGRPKHIYSIWKKMQRKGVGFEQLSDVRAVRVLVGDVKACYSVLGLVHQLWTPIPGEFDDYIAKPKANDYRSLHTAVVGPDGKVLEVQIRTQEMHQHAELGVAAHWRYKEAARRDAAYERKLAWLRQILDWRDELTDAGQLAESFRSELREESVYVLTPQGRVIDLPQGATPIDFAYHVHTELGHHCRGARVNGQMVPLTYRLRNGQVVDIVAAKEGGPSRDWLNPALGYLKSNRSRTKVRQWFNTQAADEAIALGRNALERELQRLGRVSVKHEELAQALGYAQPAALYLAFQRGEIGARELLTWARGEPHDASAPTVPLVPARTAGTAAATGGILVVGIDRLLTVLARCCRPVPPNPIVGFVSRGRGVSVHRQGCSNLQRLPPERLVPAQWGRQSPEQRFSAAVELIAANSPELMRDILDVFSREKVSMTSSNSSSRDLVLRMQFTVEVDTLTQLDRVLDALREVAGVSTVRRR